MTADSINVQSVFHHTDGDVVHPEGEVYAVTDRTMLETLVAIGFVAEAPPDPGGIDPLPEGGARRDPGRRWN